MPEPNRRQDLESELARLNQRLEQAEPEPEERFRICVETLLDGFAILKAVRDETGAIRDFRYDFINEAGCRLNQRSREDTLGRTLLHLLPGHRDGLFEAYCRVVETGEPLAREMLFYEDEYGRGQRLRRAFDFRAVKLGDGFAVTWRDTTERCQTEGVLREQEFRFRAIFEHSSEAILLTTLPGGILAANPAACRIVGRPEEDICAGGREGLVDMADPGIDAFIETRLRTGHAEGELTLKRRDGTRFPAFVSSSVFTHPDGQQLTVILLRDLTEPRRLEASSRRLAALVESSQDAIYAADLEGVITAWNRGAAALYGYAPTEALGRTPDLIVPPDRRAEFAELFFALRSGERLRTLETQRQRKDGSLVPVSVTASPILQPDGTLTGYSVIGRDITAQVEAAAERERLIEELRAALAEVRTLSGLVPICARCKRIRDDQGYWQQLEKYIQDRSEARFSHGICPSCAAELYPEFVDGKAAPS